MMLRNTISWVWIIIIALVAGDTLGLALTHMNVPASSLLTAGISVGVMLILSFIYTKLRPDERLATLTQRAAELLAYSIALGIFGYLVATWNFPLIDAPLDAADKAIGFDWPGFYQWVQTHRAIRGLLIAAYDSVVPQLGLLMLILVSMRRYDRARLLLWLYIVTSLSYVVISGFLPAAGAFGFYQTALDTPYVRQFYALREHSIHTLDLFAMQGVVQFPSFHFALAVICTYVTRGIRFLFPLFAGLNAIVIVATPPVGGHFLADLWVSAILTAGLIYITERRLASA